MERRFVAVKHHEFAWSEPVDLPTEFGADGPSRPRDQNALASEVVGDGLDVSVNLVTTEEVGGAEVTDVADADAAFEQLADRRQHFHGQARFGSEVGELADQVGASARDGNQHSLRRVARCGGHQLAAGADDGDTHDLEIRLPGIVVEQRHRDIGAARVSEHDLDDLGAAFTGAVHDEP